MLKMLSLPRVSPLFCPSKPVSDGGSKKCQHTQGSRTGTPPLDNFTLT